ncbi:MAG TPA: CDP-alcohol phosphatidyltransferase family protein [Chlamydiales bacterium]|jgi:phosphatidylglycerophosphate synthase
MFTLSNSLSFVRAPLAFLFLLSSPTLRLIAITLAMITDSIDGYVARRSQSASRFGAILDPAMDKFFVYFALIALFWDGKIAPLEMAAIISRDFFLFLYASVMLATGRWKGIVFRSVRWGKATTALQFVVLMGLVSGVQFPWYLFATFIVMGWFAFLELFRTSNHTSSVY